MTEMQNEDVMPNQSASYFNFDRLTQLVIPFIIFGLGAVYTWVSKLDDRQYSMKDEYMSKQEFNIAVSRLEMTVDSRISAMERNTQLRQKEFSDQVTGQLGLLSNQMVKVDDKLNMLAVDLEKKTKPSK